MAYTLIGCTVIGTFMILLFLPALYTVWFCIKPIEESAMNADHGAALPGPYRPGLILRPSDAQAQRSKAVSYKAKKIVPRPQLLWNSDFRGSVIIKWDNVFPIVAVF